MNSMLVIGQGGAEHANRHLGPGHWGLIQDFVEAYKKERVEMIQKSEDLLEALFARIDLKAS